MTLLREALASPAAIIAGPRGLREDAAAYARRADGVRRSLLAAHGGALIAGGRMREGLDTLRLAAEGTWNPKLFTTLRNAYVAAGDSAGALAMRLRIAADPRTPPDTAAAFAAAGRLQVGARAWDSLTAEVKEQMHSQVLADQKMRSLRGSPSRLTADGRSHSLREITKGEPAVVIFWSRHCGYAIEATPVFARIADRLAKQGRRLLFVVDEAPSAELTRYLASQHWTQPAYYEVLALTASGHVQKTLHRWGSRTCRSGRAPASRRGHPSAARAPRDHCSISGNEV